MFRNQITSCCLLIIAACFLTNCSRPVLSDSSNGKAGSDSLTANRTALLFGGLSVDTPPEKLYATFNQFCRYYFGSHRDTLYHTYASQPDSTGENTWVYSSERSATIAWETRLPSLTYIEYGPTTRYGFKTSLPERNFYLHIHYLQDLKPSSEYHYRCVSIDENGRESRTQDFTFKTRPADPNTIYLSSKMGAPPYILDKANTTYVLTEDIVAGKTAFDIRAGGIILDLGGRTVVHATDVIDSLDYAVLSRSGIGIRRRGSEPLSGLKIYNGVIKQGNALNNLDYLAGEDMLRPDKERRERLSKNANRGFSNIEISGFEDVEIAGVTSEYHFPQTWGMRFDSAHGSYDIHHNIFLDKGTQMFDRHGAGGARSLGFQPLRNVENSENQFRVHHNLVKRTRQNAINVAGRIYNNEIYVDSWVVNSFAIQPASKGGRVLNNKMFLTGYYACGVLWADEDLLVGNNLIHMEGVKTMIERPMKGKRLIETWGEQDVLAGMRITNYGKGGQPRRNLKYQHNIILGNARHGSEIRGTEFFSDYSIKNLIFEDNIVKIIAEDTTTRASCINTQGAFNDRSAHQPIFYNRNLLISNTCNIRFGDFYGQGSNHRFRECTIVRQGKNPDYHTFVFDGRNSVFNHKLLDCKFTGGAAYNDVYWCNTQSLSNYGIDWTLTLKTVPEADVFINDSNGRSVFTGKSGLDGQIQVVLTQRIIRPVEWKPDGREETVEKKYDYQEEKLSPYTVVVHKAGDRRSKTIELVEKSTLEMY